MILQAYPPRQAQEGACRFHSAVPAESSQAATRRSRLGARTQARWLQAANPRPRRPGAALHDERGELADRYPRIADDAAQIKGHAIIDAEVVCLDSKGIAQFELLHNRGNDDAALALAFDLLLLDDDDLRKRPLLERKSALARLLIRSRGGIQYVEHADDYAERMFAAVCELGLEGIVSKRRTSVYRSSPRKAGSR
jgi:ATP dependent DNA ligase domain